MSTSKEFQSLAARKEEERLPELVLTLGSTRLLLVYPRVFWQCTFLKEVNKFFIYKLFNDLKASIGNRNI